MNFKIFFIVDAYSLPASHFCSMVKNRHNTNQKWTFNNNFINPIWFSIKWGNLWVFSRKEKMCALFFQTDPGIDNKFIDMFMDG